MSSDLAISADGLTKEYRIGVGGRTTSLHQLVRQNLRHPLQYRGDRRPRHTALADVSFDLERGGAMAVIGRNGAGKSTLLKILSRITLPTRGTARLNGMVGSLLEVGTGFHPELTGRENVFLNGAILGMRHRDIERRFDDIVEFSGITEYLDTPVKRYSSGMRVRLAFAVAAHLEPEIMIIDEVLAVGDAAFQRRCLDKMRQVSEQDGRTVLFVSHNLVAVQFLCDRTIYLENGRVEFDGDTDEAIGVYLGAAALDRPDLEAVGVFDLSDAPRVPGADDRVFRRLEIRAPNGVPTDSIHSGGRLHTSITLEGMAQVNQPAITLRIYNEHDQLMCRLSSRMKPLRRHDVPGSSAQQLVVDVPELPLTPGAYSIDVHLRDEQPGPGLSPRLVDHIRVAGVFHVLPANYLGTGYVPTAKDGAFLVDWDWELRTELDATGTSAAS